MRWPTWFFKKQRADWMAQYQQQLEREMQEKYAPKLQQMQSQLEQQEDQLEHKQQEVSQRLQFLESQTHDQELLLQDRKDELLRANEELRMKVRIAEAKSSPSSVWVEAFSQGFEKAWDSMWPLLAENIQKSRGAIEQIAIDQTMNRLEDVIIQRAEKLGQVKAREIADLQQKKDEFNQKLEQSRKRNDAASVAKYEHYLEALSWMLDANHLHPH